MLESPCLTAKYRIDEVIGQGAFSVVYRATELLCDRRVAIKALQRDAYEDGSDHYALSEISALGRIWEHPNIVSIHTVEPGDDKHVAYLVMEYVAGGSLREHLRAGLMPLEQTLALAYDICCGLSHAHSENVIHRDVKPRNVLCTADKVAKVSDFGVAQIKEARHDYASTFAGTRRYMAPEQYDEVYDHRVDIFAAGILLWEMATGEFPYPGETSDVVRRSKERQASPPDWLPDPVREILDACLRPMPFERFRSMDDMRDALERVLMEDYERLVLDRVTERDSGAAAMRAPSEEWKLRRIPPASARCLEQLVTVRFRDHIHRQERERAEHKAAECATSMVLRVCRGDFESVDAGIEELAASGVVGEEMLQVLTVTTEQLRAARASGRSATAKPRKARSRRAQTTAVGSSEVAQTENEEERAQAWRQEGRRHEECEQRRKARSAYRRSGKVYVRKAAEAHKLGQQPMAARLYQDAGESYRLAEDTRRYRECLVRAAECWAAEAQRHQQESARELAANASRAAARAYEQANSPHLARPQYETASTLLYAEARDFAGSEWLGRAETLCHSSVELAIRANSWALADQGRHLINEIRRIRGVRATAHPV